MLLRRACALVLAPCLGVTLLVAVPAGADPGPPPNSMAAMGDSITRAYNASGFFIEWTTRSWTTGGGFAVNSHYRRILRRNPAISGRNFNDASSGARIADLPAQAGVVAGRGVDYVTILIGAGDACTATEEAMTSVSSFRSNLDAALATLKTRLPAARVAISSVPDIKRLWFFGKDSPSARSAWSTFGICQSMLANPTSQRPVDEERRDRVRQRVVDFNLQLAQACAAYGPNCDWDDNAVFGYPFLLSHISSWDYFHPNVSGQNVLADVTYAAGFNW